MTSMATNREVGHRFAAEVLNGKNLDALDALVAEDFVELDPLPGQGPGREGLKQTLAMFFAGFPDLEWVIEEEIAAADKVVSRFTWRGTHRGEFLGIPATGRRVAVKGVVIDRFANARMQDSRLLMDTLGLMQQLGVIPAPAEAGS
jgi:steroid delta-isomerase-like uncharacterized protein